MRKLDREIAVLGSTSVGKSALSIRFVRDEFPIEYDPTIFRRYNMQTTINGIEYSLVLYDTAGLEQQSQISHNLLRSNGFILVYSIADAQSFEIVKDIYDRLADELMKENIPIVLIGNKSDLVEKRVISYKQGQELAKSINAAFFETSARTGNNVREGFVGLLDKIDNHSAGTANKSDNNRVNTNDQQQQQQQNQQQQQQQQQQTRNATAANNRNAAASAPNNRPQPQQQRSSQDTNNNNTEKRCIIS